MSISPERKQEMIKEYATAPNDTGSSQVQVALLTERINALTVHMQQNPKDFHSRRGLLILVGRRRRLLAYMKSENPAAYGALIARLGLRK